MALLLLRKVAWVRVSVRPWPVQGLALVQEPGTTPQPNCCVISRAECSSCEPRMRTSVNRPTTRWMTSQSSIGGLSFDSSVCLKIGNLLLGVVFHSENERSHCPLLKLTERLGLSTQNDPRKQRKNANSFVLRVEALLSGIVLGGQTQSP